MSDSIDLTQAIRTLSVAPDTVDDAFEEEGGTALLLCRDADSKKWGTRWLAQNDFQVTVPSDVANAIEIARNLVPDVIIVDAAGIGQGKDPLFVELQDADDIDASIIVICANARDVKAAQSAGVFDIARKPLDWPSISKRCRNALQLKTKQSAFDEANGSLQKALEVANVARKRLRSQETFEPVTGLPNRLKFMDLLRRGMRASDRDGTTLIVLAIGFTRFRLVIEAMGQDQADRILTAIGRTIAECLTNTSSPSESSNNGLRTAAIASLDQFRFGLMMTDTGSDDDLAMLIQQLTSALSRPIQVSGQVVHLSACLGVAMYPQDADEVDSLLQRADNAMRDAQSRGGGFKYYCSETDAAAARKLKLEHMLHESLNRNELSLAYQPILDVASGEMRAVEALLRWRQPDNSYIPPEEFVAVAEESGLMIRTGEFALDGACRQFAEWRESGFILPYICVNVAKAQLMSGGFALSVKRILKKYEMDAAQLELEISERGVLSGDYDVIAQLHELKDLGIKLSIDDFGTGDSAIAYLKELPVDTLKIDRSYISGITDDGKDAAIASAMVALAQRLNMSVVAEGVETNEQLMILRELGCDTYQGFLTAAALSPGSLRTFATEVVRGESSANDGT